ncbi:MAG: DUF2268 domain-containing putative Zn-dependent protease [Kofleriaceae bacterium]
MSTAPRAAAHELALRSVMPEFWRWWAGIEHASLDQQADGFWAGIVRAHPELYSTSVMGQKFGDETYARAKIRAYFEKLPSHVEDMRSISARMPELLRTGYARFSAAFPDVQWHGPVYVMPSLFNFDGGTRLIDGKPQLVFAPDGIALYHAMDSKPDGPCAFFAHELFHIYHQQFFASAPDTETAVWQLLWTEGLATYVGAQLCPHATEAEVFISATLAIDVPPKLALYARELRGQTGSTEDKILTRWFTAGTTGDVPSRAGYYLGYQVARRAARTYSLQQLARLDGPTVRALIDAELDALARDGK